MGQRNGWWGPIHNQGDSLISIRGTSRLCGWCCVIALLPKSALGIHGSWTVFAAAAVKKTKPKKSPKPPLDCFLLELPLDFCLHKIHHSIRFRYHLVHYWYAIEFMKCTWNVHGQASCVYNRKGKVLNYYINRIDLLCIIHTLAVNTIHW